MKYSKPIILASILIIGFIIYYFLWIGVFKQKLQTNNSSDIIKVYFPNSNDKNIDAELAIDDLSRAEGLMNREKLADNTGMLFVFPEERNLSFWMKDTYIPLDMIFIDESKKIVTIHKNARPFDLNTYKSNFPSKYVLEVNGGFCDKYAIDLQDPVVFNLPHDLPIK